MNNLFDNFEIKYLPLYIIMVILIGCMFYFGQKHIREAFKEVKAKKEKMKINSIKNANNKKEQTT
jgi:uncharacterized membrane protein